MSNRQLRVAVVGSGQIACAHIRAFNAHENAQVVAIHSRTEEKAQRVAAEMSVPAVASDLTCLVADYDIELVVVAVPITQTRDVLLQLISQGTPILAEKPVGIDLYECAEIVEVAKEASVSLWVGLNRRCYSATTKVAASLANDLGQRLIEVHDQQSTIQARKLGFPETVLQNWMYANSIHLVDYIAHFGRGKIENVTVLDDYQLNEEPGLVSARVAFTSGDVAFYKAVWEQPGPWSCSVTTASNRWEMRPLESVQRQKAGARQMESLPVDRADTDFKPGFFKQAGDVLEAVRSGVQTQFVPDGIEALRVTQLVSQIYRTV